MIGPRREINPHRTNIHNIKKSGDREASWWFAISWKENKGERSVETSENAHELNIMQDYNPNASEIAIENQAKDLGE